MTQRTHTPTKALVMTIGEWRLRLAELCRDCALADSDGEGDCLRLAYALLLQAPERCGEDDMLDLGAFLTHLPPMARVEALVDQGAMECVALALLPEEASYLISRSGGGAWLASVFLPGMHEEVSSEGDSLAMALTSSLLAALAHVSQCLPADDPVVKEALMPVERESWARSGEARTNRLWQRPAGTLLN